MNCLSIWIPPNWKLIIQWWIAPVFVFMNIKYNIYNANIMLWKINLQLWEETFIYIALWKNKYNTDSKDSFLGLMHSRPHLDSIPSWPQGSILQGRQCPHTASSWLCPPPAHWPPLGGSWQAQRRSRGCWGSKTIQAPGSSRQGTQCHHTELTGPAKQGQPWSSQWQACRQAVGPS